MVDEVLKKRLIFAALVLLGCLLSLGVTAGDTTNNALPIEHYRMDRRIVKSGDGVWHVAGRIAETYWHEEASHFSQDEKPAISQRVCGGWRRKTMGLGRCRLTAKC